MTTDEMAENNRKLLTHGFWKSEMKMWVRSLQSSGLGDGVLPAFSSFRGPQAFPGLNL